MLTTGITTKKVVSLSMMTNKIYFLIALFVHMSIVNAQQSIDTLVYHSAQQKTVFILTATAGYYHKEAIPAGKQLLQKLAENNTFNLMHSSQSKALEAMDLSQTTAVVFLCTTLDILDKKQEEVFQGFIRNGGGFVGIHAAADTEYDWPWYGQLVGAYFESHPPGTPLARLTTIDPQNPLTNHLPQSWEIYDEWYNYNFQNPNIISLLNLEESSYEGGKNGPKHPISWYHSFDGGRSFYTGLGHKAEVYEDPRFVQFLEKGLAYAMGVSF